MEFVSSSQDSILKWAQFIFPRVSECTRIDSNYPIFAWWKNLSRTWGSCRFSLGHFQKCHFFWKFSRFFTFKCHFGWQGNKTAFISWLFSDLQLIKGFSLKLCSPFSDFSASLSYKIEIFAEIVNNLLKFASFSALYWEFCKILPPQVDFRPQINFSE